MSRSDGQADADRGCRNVVAYSIGPSPPLPYRFKASSLRLQIPRLDVQRFLPDSKFVRVMKESATWRSLRTFYFALRAWSRRTIWGDGLFLRFQGPATILLQSRAARSSDVLTTRDVDEMAHAPAGSMPHAVTLQRSQPDESKQSATASESQPRPVTLSVASVGRDGQVAIQSADDFKSFTDR